MNEMHWHTLLVQIDGKEHRVEIPEGFAGNDVCKLDGEPLEVEYTTLKHNHSALLRVSGKQVDVQISGTPERVVLQYDGVTTTAKVESERARLIQSLLRTTGATSQAVTITSPMPGLVQRLLKEAGQPVKRGEPVLILEAMKMENEIRSPKDGVLGSYSIKAGQTVEKGMSLVSIEAEAA